MVKESVNLLELLRKQAAGGDLDFLREAVAVLAEAVMEAEVAAQVGAGYGERSETRLTRRNGYRHTALGHTRRHHRVAYPEAAPGQLLPGSARAAPTRGAGPARRGPARVRRGRLDPPRRRPRTFARLRGHLQEPGLEDLRRVDTVVTASSSGRTTAVRDRYLWLSARSPSGCARRAASPRSASWSPPPSTPTAREVLGIDVGTSEDGALLALDFSADLVSRAGSPASSS